MESRDLMQTSRPVVFSMGDEMGVWGHAGVVEPTKSLSENLPPPDKILVEAQK